MTIVHHDDVKFKLKKKQSHTNKVAVTMITSEKVMWQESLEHSLNYRRWCLSYIFLRTFTFLSSLSLYKNSMILVFRTLLDHHQWTIFKLSPVVAKLVRKTIGQYKTTFYKGVRPEMMVIKASKESFTSTGKPSRQSTAQLDFHLGNNSSK